MQEINNDIAATLRTPNVPIETPAQALEQNVRIADIAAQVRQRKAEAADYAAKEPLRSAQTLAQTQQLAEDTALKQAFSKALKPYDPTAGDLQFDDNVAGQTLDSIQIPGIGPASYLRGRYQTEKDSQLASHRTQTLKEASDYIAKVKMAATPAENFLAIEDPKEQAKQYASVREAVVRTDPSIAKQFPYELTDENRPTVVAKLQQIADHKKQIEDVHDTLKGVEDRQKLAVATPEGKAKALKALDQSTADRMGVTVDRLDQEQKDANYKEIYGSAVVRKSGSLKQVPGSSIEGSKLPADATGLYGEDLDRSPGVFYTAVQHPDGTFAGYTSSTKQFATKTPTSASLALAAAGGDQKAATALKSLQTLRASQQSAGLTPETLDMIARQFVTTGQMPSMGMGGIKDREAVLNKAGEIAKGQNIAANSAEYRQLQGSTAALQKSHDAIVSFETTASKNLDNAIAAAKKLEDTGSPILNKPLRSIDVSVLGSPEVAAYNAARQVAVNEIAKVTSNPTLSGQLSDTARAEVSSFLPEEATIQQIMAVAQILKLDMENRRTSLADQIKFNNGRIKGVGGAVVPPVTFSPNNPYAPKK